MHFGNGDKPNAKSELLLLCAFAGV